MIELERSPMECARFGIEVLRATGHGTALGAVREEAVARGADLVVVRADAADWAGTHALERAGALLMDTHLSFERATEPLPPDAAAPFSVRPAAHGDGEAVAALARASFTDYGGHFHADPRLAPRATEVYEDWATRSLADPAAADAVLVAEDPAGALVGFTTLRLDRGTAVGVLDAVAPQAQGRGVYTLLGRARIAEAHARGAAHIVVRTHLVNLGARRGLARLGFLPSAQEHTFHLWVEDAQGRRADDDATAS